MAEREEPQAEAKAPRPTETDFDLAGFLSQFTGPAYQYPIIRIEPQTAVIAGKARRTGGHLITFHTPPTIDQIRETWGGGLFEIRVMGPKEGSNGPKILTQRRFDVAGDPKLPPDRLVDEPP